MRHVLLPGAPATRPYRVGQPTATARLVALTGSALGVISRLLRTAAGAVDLATVAAAADQHLSAATRTHEQPRRRFRRRRPARTWTTSAMLGIMPRHACSARCGARRRSGLGGLGRRRACQSGRLSPRHCVLDARRHAAARAHALWVCGQRKSVAHIPTGSATATDIDSIIGDQQASPALLAPPITHTPAPPAPSSPCRCAIFARIQAAIDTKQT
jgi:hypothetical protein